MAYDQAFDLPPVQKDLGFLRQCFVLATLCHYVYSFRQEDVGSISNVELRLAGTLRDTAAVSFKLLHFRYADSWCWSYACRGFLGLIAEGDGQSNWQVATLPCLAWPGLYKLRVSKDLPGFSLLNISPESINSPLGSHDTVNQIHPWVESRYLHERLAGKQTLVTKWTSPSSMESGT